MSFTLTIIGSTFEELTAKAAALASMNAVAHAAEAPAPAVAQVAATPSAPAAGEPEEYMKPVRGKNAEALYAKLLAADTLDEAQAARLPKAACEALHAEFAKKAAPGRAISDTPEAREPVEDKPAPKAEATDEDVRNVMRTYVEKFGRDALTENAATLLGAPSVSALGGDPGKHAAAIERIEAALAAGAADPLA